MKILIVDDGKNSRYLLKALLTGRGHQVIPAVNGKEALEAARKDRPDLIISDILMPVMDGFEFCRQVGKDPALKEVPFVYYTATYTDPKDEELAYIVGADRFIRKPTDPEEFLKIIGEVVQKAGTGKIRKKQGDIQEEKQVLKLYNEQLVKKLEKKMLDFESACAEKEEANRRLTLFRTLIDYSNDAIFVVNPGTGKILDVDEAACRGLGYSREELLSLSIWEIDYEMEDATAWEGRVRDLKRIGHDLVERRHLRKDGTFFPVEINVRYVALEESDYIIAVVRDVTERKALEAQLLRSQKMEAVGRFAGGIAHDFNNILTAVIGHAELLLLDTSLEGLNRESVLTIREAADRAAQLTRQLLAFTRRQVLEPVVLDVNEVIRGMSKILARMTGEDVEYRLNLDPEVREVKADPGQVEQVIMNLVVNAREVMPRGGRLTLTTGEVSLDEAACRMHLGSEPGDYLLLTVTDTGTGMSEEVREHLFEPFFTTKQEGTGLGLSTVYGIVEQMGGSIHVYSEEEEGTTFKIYLPLCKEGRGEREKDKKERKAVGGRETILLVEDEEAILSLAEKVLGELGYTVLAADRAEAAMERLREHRGEVDLLVTDVILPGKSGPMLARQVRGEAPGIRVLFMSGYADDRIEALGDREQKTPFLPKPFTPTLLARKIREVLDGG